MRPIWFGVIAVGAAILGAGGWWVTSGILPQSASAPTPTVSPADAHKKIEDLLNAANEYQPFFKLLRDTFPADYAVDVDRFAARMVKVGQPDSVDFYFNQAYGALRQIRGVVAAKASPAALSRVFDADAALLKGLGAVDAHLCVDFIYGGATQAYFDFASTHRATVAELGNAGLAAIIDGKSGKIERVPPGDGDFQAWEKALAGSGLSKGEIAVLIDGKAPNPPISDARMCTIEQSNLAALKSLPEDQRWRIYRLKVEMMART